MLINASQDSIINTAKSVGLDPNAVAANTAIADQAFFASMQTQGRLAQNYLPLAKAYLTAIIIGLSWLIAIIAIIFGNYAHLKMFFTLCLWIFLWTPIFCLINFLNDLNLIKTAEIILDKKEALTISSNMLIFKKIAANSNFINYLIMAVPVLAFAIAKGTEHGLVSFASSLSQAVSGAARSASSFTTQQALSTSTAIAAPRADELIATSGGITTHTNARNIDGIVTSFASKTAGVGNSNTDINNANMSGTNIDGKITGVKLNAGTLNTINSTAESSSKTWNKQFNDTYQDLSQKARSSALNEAKEISEGNNDSFKKSFGSNIGQEISHRTDLTETQKANITAYAKAQLGVKVLGSEIAAGVEGKATKEWGASDTLSSAEKAAYSEIMERASVKTLAENHSLSSTWSQTLNGSDSVAYSKMTSYADAYNQTQSAVQSVNSNNIDNTMNAYARDLATADGKDFNNLSTAEQNSYFAKAGNQISDMIKNDPALIAKYNSQYGAGSNVVDNNIPNPKAADMGFKKVNGSDRSVLLNHNRNMEQVKKRSSNENKIENLPKNKEELK